MNKFNLKLNIIRHFTPNWFTVTMGTGIVSLSISELPFLHDVFFFVGTLLWILNILLFILFSGMYAARWIYFYQEAKLILNHSQMLFFLGAIPMGLATIINGCLKYGSNLLNNQMIFIAQNLWYLDVFLAILVSLFVPAMMFTRQNHELKTMTAVWLLPIVTAEVAASSGGLLLANHLSHGHALTVLIGSYMLWGLSVLPAFCILAILFLRMALHKLPEQSMTISGCLAFGPIGTGVLSILLLGKQAPQVLNPIHMAKLGEFMHYFGILGSLILIGFGFWWFIIALFTIYRQRNQHLNFNLGWWALTFPLGVYNLAILELGRQLSLQPIQYIAYLLIILTIIIWLVVIFKTILGAYHKTLFVSPCLIAELNKYSS